MQIKEKIKAFLKKILIFITLIIALISFVFVFIFLLFFKKKGKKGEDYFDQEIQKHINNINDLLDKVKSK